MKEANRRKFIEKPLSDYNRSIKKSYQESKSRSSSSDVPQLGAQEKQSIQPLVVLNQEQQGFLGFLQSTKLTTDQITGASNQDLNPLKEYPIALVVRWKYKEGTSLVPQRLCLCFQCKCEGYMTCTWRWWVTVTSCRAQRLQTKISFVERPSYGLIGKKSTNYTIKTPSTSLSSLCGCCKCVLEVPIHYKFQTYWFLTSFCIS